MAEFATAEWPGILRNLRYNGLLSYLSGIFFSQVADVTVASSAAETTILSTTGALGTLSLPANFLSSPGQALRIRVSGIIANTGTPTFQVKVKLGATTVSDTTALTMATITGTSEFEMEFLFVLRTAGATGTYSASNRIVYRATAGTPLEMMANNAAGSSFDTTIGRDLNITVQWGASSASNTVTIRNVVAECMLVPNQ